jgi:hypothetical protein
MPVIKYLVPSKSFPLTKNRPWPVFVFMSLTLAGFALRCRKGEGYHRLSIFEDHPMSRLLISLSLLLFCTSSAWSAPVEPSPLFQVLVAQGGNVLAAERQGLTRVLQRLTGGQIDVSRPEVAQGLDQVGGLVRAVTPGADGLLVDFDPEGVKRLVALGVAPYWEQPRPALMFWLVDMQLPIPLVPGDTTTKWPQLFAREGAQWAIPSHFPLLDLDDLALVSADVVNQGLMPPLVKASQRYGDGLLVRGQLSQQGDQWQLQWHLHDLDSKAAVLINGQSKGTQAQVVTQTFAAISHYLAGRYGKILPLPQAVLTVSAAQATAVTTAISASGEASLQVDHVKSVDDLLALQGLLHQLPMVSQSSVTSMAGDTVTLSLVLKGDANGFFTALQDQQRLVPADAANRFHMQWRQP